MIARRAVLFLLVAGLAGYSVARGAQESPATDQAPEPGALVSPERGLPKAPSGVLPPGAADQILAVGGKPIVTLIEPGALPRAELRYALAKGTTSKMVMAMDMSMAVKVQGKTPPPTQMPRMSLGMSAAAADLNDAGEIKIDTELTTVSVDPSGEQQEQMARALRPQLEAMKGVSVAYWVNPKGYVHDVKLGIPPGMPLPAQQMLKGMTRSFESISTPLPAEPVGVGAKWQVISRIASDGADLLQSAVYTLKARDGHRITLDVVLLQLVASDTIKTAQMPKGVSAKVMAMKSGGSGSTRLNLTSISPEDGAMTLKTAMDIIVHGAGPGGSDESSVETTITMKITGP